jgi:hypothetical protein
MTSRLKIVHPSGPETIRLYTENIIDNHRRMTPAAVNVDSLVARSLRMVHETRPMVVTVTKRRP